MRKCVCGDRIRHMCRFSHFHESQIRYAHNGRKDICIWSRRNRSTFISICEQQCYCHCSCFRHCLWNSREDWNTCVMRNNSFNHFKCDTWAIRLYEITSSMGLSFDYCIWVYRQLQVTMIFMILWYALAKSEKQRGLGAVRHWHFRGGF